MHLEGDFPRSGFEPVPGYREPADSPYQVVPRTSAYLDLFLDGLIIDPEPASQFLRKATIPYLYRAKEGLEIISFVQREQTKIHWQEIPVIGIKPQDKEKLEALEYMNLIFGLMPRIPIKKLSGEFEKISRLHPPRFKI